MKKTVLKSSFYIAIVISFTIGISFSNKQVSFSGEKASVTILSLGSEAKAYCNEATYWPEVNDGKCDGAANVPNSRCQVAASNTDCTRTKI